MGEINGDCRREFRRATNKSDFGGGPAIKRSLAGSLASRLSTDWTMKTKEHSMHVRFELMISLAFCAFASRAPAADAEKLAAPPKLTFAQAEPLAEMNARFEPKEGWIGGDGAYSVAMSPRRTLWLFSDTWVGNVQDGKRTNATIVNNTVGVQEGTDPTSKLNFFVAKDAKQKPAALITPADGKGWFWLQAGVPVKDRLVLFLSQIEKSGDGGALGFKQIGRTLGSVANPLEEPTKWRVEQHKLVPEIMNRERELTFGSAILTDGDFVYLYGTDERRQPGVFNERFLIVARVPLAEVEDQKAWRFFHAGEWVADFEQADHLCGGMATEFSVSYLPAFKQYALVTTENGLSDKIMVRTGANPWGPWSEPTTVYRCPEMASDKKIFCYAAKAHPSQAAGDELVISYVANSFDFWQVAKDARLYWPRFVRVKVSAK